MTETTAAPARSNMRIPSTLQAVFLASNRGKTVSKAPPEKVASKTFFRNWFFQRKAGSNGRKGLWASKEKVKKEEQTKAQITLESALKQAKPSTPTLSPQGYLDALIRSRGYSTRRFKTLQSAYYNKPTQLQQCSYDVHLISLVRKHDLAALDELLSSGISPNPCNKYGESLVHMICRRGEHDILDVFMQNNCTLQVADDYGRTPLHDACWAAKPALQTVQIILASDPRLFHMADCRGAVPLSYVRQEHWEIWIKFIEANKDVYWPVRDILKDGEQEAPPMTLLAPNTKPVPNPKNALTVELATMVASGRMLPDEAHLLKHELDVGMSRPVSDSDSSDSEYGSDESGSSDDSGSCSSYSDGSFTDTTFDEDEMNDILKSLSTLGNARPTVAWSN